MANRTITSYFKGCVELWGKENGLSRASIAYPASFYMHLRGSNAPAYLDMIDAWRASMEPKNADLKRSTAPWTATGSMAEGV